MRITLADVWNKPTFVQKLYLPVLVNLFNAVNAISRNCDTVLDVGCGSGLLLKFNPAKLKVGLDRRITASEGPDLNFVKADAHHLPFKNHTFCCTIMVRTLAYLDDAELALRELGKVTKIDGILVVSVAPTLNEFLYFVGKLFFLRLRSFKDDFREHKNKFAQEKLCEKILGRPNGQLSFPLISILALIKGEKILVFKNVGARNENVGQL